MIKKLFIKDGLKLIQSLNLKELKDDTKSFIMFISYDHGLITKVFKIRLKSSHNSKKYLLK